MKTIMALAFLAFALAAVLLPGCGSTTTTLTGVTTTGATTNLSLGEAQLVGTWETLSMGTDWVDRLTYEFRPDGTFSYVAKKSGTTTGTEMLSGLFHTEGDGLFLTDLKETWIGPEGSTEYQDRAADDRRVLYEFTDGVLLLNGEAYSKK